MRRLASLAVVLLVAALVGCGGDSDTEAFCDEVEDFEQEFEEFDPSDTGAVDDAADRLEHLADEAPDEVKGDVKTLSEAFSDFADAFGDADPTDPAAMLGAVSAMFDKHDGEELDEAAEGINDFAEDECNVEIEDEGPVFADLQEQVEGAEIPDDSTDDSEEDTSGELPDPEPPPEVDDPELAGFLEGCVDGDMEACDDLFLESPSDSPEEEYGNTCGGREPNPAGRLCVDIFPG